MIIVGKRYITNTTNKPEFFIFPPTDRIFPVRVMSDTKLYLYALVTASPELF